jgi:hypothetical protein
MRAPADRLGQPTSIASCRRCGGSQGRTALYASTTVLTRDTRHNNVAWRKPRASPSDRLRLPPVVRRPSRAAQFPLTCRTTTLLLLDAFCRTPARSRIVIEFGVLLRLSFIALRASATREHWGLGSLRETAKGDRDGHPSPAAAARRARGSAALLLRRGRVCTPAGFWRMHQRAAAVSAPRFALTHPFPEGKISRGRAALRTDRPRPSPPLARPHPSSGPFRVLLRSTQSCRLPFLSCRARRSRLPRQFRSRSFPPPLVSPARARALSTPASVTTISF